MIDDDEFRWLKAGRLDETEARIAAMLFRPGSKSLASGMSDRSLTARSRRAAGRERGRSSRAQAVVKVAGSRKSRSGVRACVRYVARLRRCDRGAATVRDEYGRRVSRDEVMARVAEWELDDDRANASKVARLDPGRSMGERGRLRNVQAWHLVLSVTIPDDCAGKLVQAVTVMLDECFTRRGHRCLWALHLDRPGRPHVHVVVKAVSEFGERLRFDRYGDYLDSLRAEFAQCLRLAGLEYDGVRREDRVDLRNRIATGEEALRLAWRLDRGDGDLARRAPGWIRRFGRDYLRRRFPGILPPEETPTGWRQWLDRLLPPPEPQVPPEATPLVDDFAKLYRDPVRALIAWHGLAVSKAMRVQDSDHFPNRRLAEWYLMHRPELFGELRPGAVMPPDFRSKMRVLPLRAPEGDTPQPSDPAILDLWRHLHRLRRVGRDRRTLADSLVRLAEITMVRMEDAALVHRILEGTSAALRLPFGRDAAGRDTDRAGASPSGGAAISATAQSARRPPVRPPRTRGGAER